MLSDTQRYNRSHNRFIFNIYIILPAYNIVYNILEHNTAADCIIRRVHVLSVTKMALLRLKVRFHHCSICYTIMTYDL